MSEVTRHSLIETYYQYAERIAPFVTDTVAFMHEAFADGKTDTV